MLFEQHYLDCLSQASYVIADESTKRAVVVDPRRDVSPYLETAEEHGLTIELVLETHFHADFLSGHLELAAATGAEIGYGDVAVTEFNSGNKDYLDWVREQTSSTKQSSGPEDATFLEELLDDGVNSDDY